jgi:hypothetical protein
MLETRGYIPPLPIRAASSVISLSSWNLADND